MRNEQRGLEKAKRGPLETHGRPASVHSPRDENTGIEGARRSRRAGISGEAKTGDAIAAVGSREHLLPITEAEAYQISKCRTR